MSAVDNHRRRSRRGHMKNHGFLAPKHSPLIRGEHKAFRRRLNALFRRSSI